MNYVWVDTIFTEDGHERFFLEDPPAFKEKNKVLKKLAVFAVGLFANQVREKVLKKILSSVLKR